MKGWGRVPFFLGLGVWLAAGCGGRTSALEDDYVFGAAGDGQGNDGGSVAHGGSGSVAGRSNRGGSRNVGGSGVAGSGVGGSYPVAGSGYGGAQVGGAYVGGYGGSGFAGYPVGGYAGYPVGGTGFGGYAGVAVGGYAGFGAYAGFPVGGYAGAPPRDCRTCVTQACAPQLVQCFQDFGCLSIFGCMEQTGCQAFQCYSDQQCKGVIDQWGGPAGQSMSELLQTFSCAFQAGCQCG